MQPATFWLVAQCRNQLHHQQRAPLLIVVVLLTLLINSNRAKALIVVQFRVIKWLKSQLFVLFNKTNEMKLLYINYKLIVLCRAT
jgi:hypothetical protein